MKKESPRLKPEDCLHPSLDGASAPSQGVLKNPDLKTGVSPSLANIGLYNLKYPARKLIEWTLPFVRNVNPNTVSWLMLPVGFGVALCSYFGGNGYPTLFLWAPFLIVLRMFLGTLDGLMAVRFNKESPKGEIINRLSPELCDVMYLVALTIAQPEWLLLGVFSLAIAWLTTFAGLVGVLVKKPIQSVGPVGQTDRLAAFIGFSFLQYFSVTMNWQIDFIGVFLWWCIAGGLLTISFRLWRTLKTNG